MQITIDSTTSYIHSTGGIALAGKIFEKIGLGHPDLMSQNFVEHPEIIRAMAGLHIQGRTRFEEISIFRNDPFFRECFGLSYVPAPETLRIYLEKLTSRSFFVKRSLELSNQALLKRATITPVELLGRYYIPVDFDVSPFDNSKSHKEGVSRTYKGFDGYAPLFAYIGSEGYILDSELRSGSTHCQKNTPEFVSNAVRLAKDLDAKHPLLFRFDGGNDSADTIKELKASGNFFLVKRNLRKELPEQWLDIAKAEGVVTHCSERKTVYTGVHTGRCPGGDEALDEIDVVFKITERYVSKDGVPLLVPEIEVETFWTTLFEAPEDVVELWRDTIKVQYLNIRKYS